MNRGQIVPSVGRSGLQPAGTALCKPKRLQAAAELVRALRDDHRWIF